MNEPERTFRPPDDWVLEPAIAPLGEKKNWADSVLGISEAWKQSRGKGVRIAVLDSGCDVFHPDLQGAIVAAKNFSRSMRPGVEDPSGHGTWCASVIGARGRMFEGIAPECELLIGKVLGDNGSGTAQSILAGILWAMDQGADIITMSFGGPGMPEDVHVALIRHSQRPQKFATAAAGNDGTNNRMGDPASFFDCVLSIGAVGKDGQPAKFSNGGATLDIVMPGVDLLACVPVAMGSYGIMSGTSMACPIAAAVIALALSKHRTQGSNTGLENLEDLRAHLRKSCVDLLTPGRDDRTGIGMMMPKKLLDSLDPLDPVIPKPQPVNAIVLETVIVTATEEAGVDKVRIEVTAKKA